jgi:eukaryotic-like serine/threonine-protein kinase
MVFAELRALFARIAQHGPIVLVIDDLQWADADGLAVLAELMRPPRPPRVLLVATTRMPSHGDPTPPALRGQARLVRLDALPASAARALASSLLAGETTRDEMAAAIADEAAGHPLYLAELARRARRARPDGAHLRLDDVIRERVRELDATGRRLLELCAVAGRPLAPTVLAAAAAIDPREIADALSLLRGIDLVQVDSAGIGPFHDRVRLAIADALAPGDVRALHRRLAEAHETLATGDLDALVEHWRDAGQGATAS